MKASQSDLCGEKQITWLICSSHLTDPWLVSRLCGECIPSQIPGLHCTSHFHALSYNILNCKSHKLAGAQS